VNQSRSLFSFVNVVGLQECREACGGQGIKSDNRIGQAKAEYDVQLTFEGDNNVLMQQVDICCCSSIAFKKSV
jgi:acyl-CoA oxidase